MLESGALPDNVSTSMLWMTRRLTGVLTFGFFASLAAAQQPSAPAEPASRGAILVGAPGSADVPAGTDFALLIGNDDYQRFPRLSNPVRDVTALEEELRTVYRFETKLLTNATESAILEELRSIALREWRPEDQVFIFYAGHGEVDDVDEGYISGVDTTPIASGGRSALSHSYVRRMVTRISAKHVFLVMDSCFSGTFDPRIAGSGTRSVYERITSPELMRRNLGLEARLWLTSGRNEAVSDGLPGQGSPFARMVLDGLRSYGGDTGVVTSATLFSAAQSLQTQPAWGELPNHSPGGQFVFAVGGRANIGNFRPVPPLERERPLIAQALEHYQAAYRSRSVEALLQVYPSLSRGERDGLQRTFTRDCRGYDVQFESPQIALTNADATTAQVTVNATYTCTPVIGQRPQRADTQDVFELRKLGDRWEFVSSTSKLRR
jgi:hypothetical protein